MGWWAFRQNNSGGSFDENFGYVVFVEADDPDHANSRAEGIGIYFDGVANQMDCPCCGDRWRPNYVSAIALDTDGLKSEVAGWLEGAKDWKLPVGILPRHDQVLILVNDSSEIATWP